MIFLSHNHADKAVVEQIALQLREAVGQQAVFYDSWSMQPGDGIVDKMNDALGETRLFLFFVSKNSLQSNMVKLEWQNAVMKQARGDLKIVPVKLDDCLMPPILMQSIYIDLFGNGLEIATRQIVDVLAGRNTFQPGPQRFSNLHAYAHSEADKTTIEIHAEHYLEPISNFLFLTKGGKDDFEYTMKSASMCLSGFHEEMELTNGSKYNAFALSVEKGTVPGFPFVVEFARKGKSTAQIELVMHEKKRGEWSTIPFSQGSRDSAE